MTQNILKTHGFEITNSKIIKSLYSKGTSAPVCLIILLIILKMFITLQEVLVFINTKLKKDHCKTRKITYSTLWKNHF